jgi:hypothetical protein
MPYLFSIPYDAIRTYICVVFVRYMMLATGNRVVFGFDFVNK